MAIKQKKNNGGKSCESVRTAVIIQFDCGYSNQLYIRGEGSDLLSWEQGIPLQNVNCSEWVWETDAPFEVIYFKVLINDEIFEAGENHQLICGNTFEYTPRFD